MALQALDGSGDLLGEVSSLEDLDRVPDWENANERTLRHILDKNDGYIEDEDGNVVWDGA